MVAFDDNEDEGEGCDTGVEADFRFARWRATCAPVRALFFTRARLARSDSPPVSSFNLPHKAIVDQYRYQKYELLLHTVIKLPLLTIILKFVPMG